MAMAKFYYTQNYHDRTSFKDFQYQEIYLQPIDGDSCVQGE